MTHHQRKRAILRLCGHLVTIGVMVLILGFMASGAILEPLMAFLGKD